MLNQAEKPSGLAQQQVPPAAGTAAPKKSTLINVDETRDEFIENAQPVADALRKNGRTAEATQLEQAAKVIGIAVGTQPRQQPGVGDSLKGESVSTVLKNLWEVIEKDPELKKMPQAQNLRNAGQWLDGAGLLNITVRNGVVVSFISNFTDNFQRVQQPGLKGSEKPRGAQESGPSAARSPLPAAENAAVTTGATDVNPTPATPANAASLLSPAIRAKAQALAEERLGNQVAGKEASPAAVPPPAKGFTQEDIPFDLLGKMGVPVAELERTGQLQKLLEGKKTDLIPSFALRSPQGETIPFAAKLVLHRDADGVANLRFDLPKHALEIPRQIMGQEITPGMKEQLQKGGVVLADGLKDGQGQSFTAYIAIDKEMNKVVAVPRAGFEVPKVLHGVHLAPDQRRVLLEGQPLQLEGMVSNNRRFDATMQLDPIKRTIICQDAQFHEALKQVPEHTEGPSRRGVRL